MPSSTEPSQLREALLDRQQPRSQSQAALLLVTHGAPEAEEGRFRVPRILGEAP